MLLALALRDETEFFRQRTIINSDKSAAERLRPTLYNSFRKLVSSRFGNGEDRREVIDFLAQPRAPLWPGATLPLLESEAMIREALGEQGLTDGIPGSVTAPIRLQLLVYLMDDLKMSPSEKRELISDVEQLVDQLDSREY